jgi:hypothetical protein
MLIHRCHGLGRKQIARVFIGRLPIACRGKTQSGNDDMHTGMQTQILSPGMQQTIILMFAL